MLTIQEVNSPETCKAFIHDTFMKLIKDLVDQETQIISNHHNNPTIPFDYYNLMLREINTKIACKKEVYKFLTGEDLE
ncbi:MAG TPA: hypothetical protein VJ792_08555 [Candidatus Nitrosotalea sp.]|nr:hypothetical protein [Candidatus Nitrosotalea sp.]